VVAGVSSVGLSPWRATVAWSVRTVQSNSLKRTHTTMALDQSALLDLLAQLKLTDVTDRIRSATETLYQELIDAEATAFIGASPFERSAERTTGCNGTRPRTLTKSQLEEAARLQGDGWSMNRLGAKFGLDPKTMKVRLAGAR